MFGQLTANNFFLSLEPLPSNYRFVPTEARRSKEETRVSRYRCISTSSCVVSIPYARSGSEQRSDLSRSSVAEDQIFCCYGHSL